MKFNWGHGLALGMALFMGYIIYFVVWSFDVNHELETENYYSKELKFQEQIDKSKNHTNLEHGLFITSNEESILFKFPQKSIDSGSITFYRPSGRNKDFKLDISVDELGEQIVQKSELSKGRYVIKSDWSSEGKSYYYEKNIVI